VFRESAIQIEGEIVQVLGAKICWVVLPNGHRVLGHLSARKAVAHRLNPGERVVLEMSPFDFSKGRIRLKEEEQNLNS
jgi:translation initiation factor IF-1